MAWQGPATRKQQDKSRDKVAKVAQAWLKRGFTPKQVADSIHNKAGYFTDVKGDTVRFWGFYNDESRKQERITREITTDTIIKRD